MEAIPFEQVGERMRAMIPFIQTTGLEYGEVTANRAEVRLPDVAAYRNHVGGPHAAMMFAAAETAAGAVAFAAFSDLFDRVVLVPFRIEVDFLKVALGPLTAVATLDPGTVRAVRTTLDGGTRPEFEIPAELTTADGEVTGQFRSRWTMRRLPTSA